MIDLNKMNLLFFYELSNLSFFMTYIAYTVSYEIRLKKVEFYRITADSVKWFDSYHSNRS